ncbi:MAG: hypothetical protein HWD92_03580 [Flavobacteriia bacterium]|nr:hypothetical protein [Flavobacteriia bacterium]
MIRIIYDEIGDAHNDIFLKVDTGPPFLKVVDSYYLGDFLKQDFESKEEVVLGYLEYFKEQILCLRDEQTFIAVDLSDEYVGGFFISNGVKSLLKKKGVIRVEYGSTTKISGWGVNEETIAGQVDGCKDDFSIDREWLISKDAIIDSLNWSIDKIRK